MKKLILTVLMMLNMSAFAGTKLKDFNQALDALDQGELLTFVIQNDQCEFDKSNPKPASLTERSIYRPNGLLVHPDGYIKVRGSNFSQTIASNPKLKNVQQAYTFIFTKDNELKLTANFLDPVTLKQRSKPYKATCKLGKGFEVFA